MAHENIPRRICVEWWTPAEKAIKDAMYAVEAAGAHPLLTEAVVLLQQAFEKVADHTDSIVYPDGADRNLVRLALTWGLHPEEALPRAETWLHERQNWQAEVRSLRAHIATLKDRLKQSPAQREAAGQVMEKDGGNV